MIIHDPGNQDKISEIYAYLSQDALGNEGICAFYSGVGWTPMVSGTAKGLARFRDHAIEAAAKTNNKIVAVKFSQRTDLEVIEGAKT